MYLLPDAQKHIGATKCVTGKVLRVKQGNNGVHFFDFCEDYRVCPFTVVVFPGDLKRIGDIRRLQGTKIEIDGEVKGYEGRAEIILRRVSQLRGDAGTNPSASEGIRRRTQRQVQRWQVQLSESGQAIPA